MTHGMRSPEIVLRALNVELTQALAQATDPRLAAVRLQWWRDQVDVALRSERVPDHPVLRALQQLHLHRPLSKYRLHRLVDARAAEAGGGGQPETLGDLEGAAEAVESSTNYLIAEACGVGSRDLDHALSHLGKATGMALALAGTVPGLARGSVSLPRDLW